MRTLVIESSPKEGESMSGYLVRLAEINAIPKLAWILGLISERTGKKLRRPLDLLTSRAALAELETLAAVPRNVLVSRAMANERTNEGSYISTQDWTWHSGALAIERHQVCPDCLRTSAHHREAWSYYYAPICPIHESTLVSRCPRCGAEISSNRSAICHCVKCNFDFREMQSTKVSEALAAFAGRIQGGGVIPFGTPDYDEPIAPNEIYALWCLALLPRRGQRIAVKPVRGADIPIESRIEAFEVLENAWDGRRLDSRQVRASLLKRWDHLAAIPSERLIKERLAKSYRAVQGNPEILSMLLDDEQEMEDHWTIQEFGKRPPQWKTPAEAAEFLGIPEDVFRKLSSRSRFPVEYDRDEGYDGDRILAMREFLGGLLSAEQVDAALGVPGSAAELERAGLLRPWKALESLKHRFVPHDLADIFDHVFERLAPGAHGECKPLVTLVAEEQLTPEFMASVLAGILNAAITPLDWRPPYRLVDLSFTAEEIHGILSRT